MMSHPSFPLKYVRYVDDTFCLSSTSQQALDFLSFCNSIHPNIEFTIETENENKLPFLDVLVTRANIDTCTSVYRKGTFTGLYFHFSSFMPQNYKVSLIASLIYRCYMLSKSKSYECFDEGVKTITNFLKLNSFPGHLINSTIYKVLDKIYTQFFL